MEAKWFDRKFNRWVFPQRKSKGKKRRRVVYLNEVAAAITERLCLKYPEGPIFRQNGKAWDRNTVRCKFRRLKEKLNLPELCAYTLRHSWATRQLNGGMDAYMASLFLGHTSMDQLQKTYSHVDQNPQLLSDKLNSRKVG